MASEDAVDSSAVLDTLNQNDFERIVPANSAETCKPSVPASTHVPPLPPPPCGPGARPASERETPSRLENPVLLSHKGHAPMKVGHASTLARSGPRVSGAANASGASNFLDNGRGHCSDLDLPSFDRLPVKPDLHRPDSVITTSSIVSGASETGDIVVVPPPPPPDVYTISGLYGGNVSHQPSLEVTEARGHKRSTSNTAASIIRGCQMTHKRSHSHTVGYNHKRSGSSGFVMGHRRTASGALVEALDKMTGGALETHQTTTEFLQSIQKQELERRASRLDQEEVEEDYSQLRDCGYLACKPGFATPLASIKVFVLLLSSLVTLQQALSSGYLNSVLTTIERRYEIPSFIMGLVASVYEVGNVGTVIFVSYLGSRRHIPVLIGIGVIMMGIGSIVFSLPHFLSDSYSSTLALSNETDQNICKVSYQKPQQSVLQQLGGEQLDNFLSNDNLKGLSLPPLVPHNNPQFSREDNCIKEAAKSSAAPIVIFCLAQLLLGCGGSPLFPLGTAYIDNHVPRDAASMYIGFMYSMVAFGPVLGFLMGSVLLKHFVDGWEVDPAELGINTESRDWVGMWWGGFLIIGCLMLAIALPFFAFPKELKREKRKVYLEEKYKKETSSPAKKEKLRTDEVEPGAGGGDEDYGKNLKDLPKCIWKLVTNWIFLVTCLGACMELIIVSGFIVFLPKYLETQFNLSKSDASVLTGGTAIPGACIGIFLGGYILKRMQLRPKGAVQLVLFFNVLCLCCYAVLFFLGCNNAKMAGIWSPYNTDTQENFQVNLTSSCNLGCTCDMNDYQPVCGNNVTYFSPCHAGCSAVNKTDDRASYNNCACVAGDFNASGSGVTRVPVVITAGVCSSQCEMIYPFMVLLFFMTLLVAVTQMPLLMVVLRSVADDEKAFALGIQFVIFRLFGYIPSPIMFGSVIDSTCRLWKQTCEGKQGGRCLAYDIEMFRYKYVGICAGIKTISFFIFLFDWWLIRRKTKQDKEKGAITMGEVVNSIVSLDKMFEIEEPEKPVGDGEEEGASSTTSSPLRDLGLSPTRQPMIPSSRSK